jgi:hypothetical protein
VSSSSAAANISFKRCQFALSVFSPIEGKERTRAVKPSGQHYNLVR